MQFFFQKVQQTVNRPMPVMIQPGYGVAPVAAPYAQNPYYTQAPGSLSCLLLQPVHHNNPIL